MNRRQFGIAVGRVWLAGLMFAASPLVSAGTAGDEVAIVHAMKATWDRPEAPLQVHPIVVEGDVAIVGWTQDGRGGRAFLRRKDGTWSVALCAGAMLTQSANYGALGLAPEPAKRLGAALAAAEAALPAEMRAKFDAFEGVVMVGDGGAHGQHGHGHHGVAAPADHAGAAPPKP